MKGYDLKGESVKIREGVKNECPDHEAEKYEKVSVTM